MQISKLHVFAAIINFAYQLPITIYYLLEIKRAMFIIYTKRASPIYI